MRLGQLAIWLAIGAAAWAVTDIAAPAQAVERMAAEQRTSPSDISAQARSRRAPVRVRIYRQARALPPDASIAGDEKRCRMATGFPSGPSVASSR